METWAQAGLNSNQFGANCFNGAADKLLTQTTLTGVRRPEMTETPVQTNLFFAAQDLVPVKHKLVGRCS